ncbi:MAG: DUF58 domain-containing protein [Agarilytica sp.]
MQNENIEQAPEGVYVSVDALLKLRHLAKDISLQTNKKSTALMDGDSRTSFRGRGMEFAEVRPYQAGDDIRNIDWRVTARTQKPYTKLFQEERERPVYILVDQRSPMFFGSVAQFKSVFAAKLATIVSWAAMQNNDRIGALIFSDKDQTDSRPRRGKHAALGIIHDLVAFNQQLKSPNNASENSMAEMLQVIRRVAKPGSAVFVISDFHDFSEDCEEPLAVLARHCNVTALHVYDALEQQLPSHHFLTVTDGQHRLNIAGQSQHFSQRYKANFADLRSQLKTVCNQYAVNFASLSVEESLSSLVQDLFCSRRQRKTRGR